MPDDLNRGYYIDDPRPIIARAPYTYFVASPEETAAVGVGDLVQLIFELDPPGHRKECRPSDRRRRVSLVQCNCCTT